MKHRTPILLIASLIALFAAGCGGNGQPTQVEEGPDTAAEEAPAETADEAEADDASAREVVIEANDQMQFNIENFDVQPGERIRLVLENVGTMPAASMGHNVVILTQDADAEAFVEAAGMAPTNDYIPPDMEDQIIAHTEMLGGGEEDSVTFTAPEESGEYVFLCSFPGHFQVGMRGTMTVQ